MRAVAVLLKMQEVFLPTGSVRGFPDPQNNQTELAACFVGGKVAASIVCLNEKCL
jgi:hypothetical protein